ncbi:unnamed protein product [Rhodiola kirilowii]
MPDTRSTTESIAALHQTVVDLSTRTLALEAKHGEAETRTETRFDRIKGMLERMNTDIGRLGKQPLIVEAPATDDGPLLPTPTLHLGDSSIGMKMQQQLMPHQTGTHHTDGLSRALRVDVPTFTGEAAEGWLFQMERYFTHHHVLPEQKMSFVPFYLDGEALQWYQWLTITHQIKDWDSFSTAVLRRFGPSMYYSASVLLNKLHQKTSVAAYIAEFESLSARAPEFTADLLLSRFLAGLKEERHCEIMLLCPPDLQMAMGMARIAEQKISLTRWSAPRPPGSRPGGFSRPSIPRPSPGPSGLPIKRLTPTEMVARREKGLCFNCDERFHPGYICKPKFLCLLMEEEEVIAEEDPEPVGLEEKPCEEAPTISCHAM